LNAPPLVPAGLMRTKTRTSAKFVSTAAWSFMSLACDRRASWTLKRRNNDR